MLRVYTVKLVLTCIIRPPRPVGLEGWICRFHCIIKPPLCSSHPCTFTVNVVLSSRVCWSELGLTCRTRTSVMGLTLPWGARPPPAAPLRSTLLERQWTGSSPRKPAIGRLLMTAIGGWLTWERITPCIKYASQIQWVTFHDYTLPTLCTPYQLYSYLVLCNSRIYYLTNWNTLP